MYGCDPELKVKTLLVKIFHASEIRVGQPNLELMLKTTVYVLNLNFIILKFCSLLSFYFYNMHS